ncbi:hypothetical protein CYLTODRAFT_449272 [Cylindrobasidium torrendii FP15055 ss-10]|uniref:Luciferase domain-containing protein n=1 Tax=Cylindrobasidium torrendii FP15055 ss-10 TaxID=1314674 RepID=A0A0D7BSB2_9AGAR|nr:hypothetical protein CYLTODRAFT_449272 [Cylindrobasidium torrendii FP15055 ss-10]
MTSTPSTIPIPVPVLVTLLGLSVAFTWSVDNYRKYIDLDKGGFPPNLVGWFFANICKFFGQETTSIVAYALDPDQQTWLDISKVPQREGSRPILGWHAVPHRQITQRPLPSFMQRLDELFTCLAASNADLVTYTESSDHNRRTIAMKLQPHIEARLVAGRYRREIGHIHALDHSMHLVLSPADCRAVIERGWGERHPLSGVTRHLKFANVLANILLGQPILYIPSEFIMVYAPRNETELKVTESIVMAGMAYMAQSPEVIPALH